MSRNVLGNIAIAFLAVEIYAISVHHRRYELGQTAPAAIVAWTAVTRTAIVTGVILCAMLVAIRIARMFGLATDPYKIRAN